MHKTKKELNIYERGATAIFACQFDQRFSYCAYIPKSYEENGKLRYNLAVVVHGTDRPVQRYRDEFIDFAEETNTIILAPLFPAGITKPRELNSYKFIRSGDIRFDRVLLAMVEEIAHLYRVSKERFLLYGFSGGGHFAHRFFYIHPDRLLGVSIGAPGYITLLDSSRPWHVGVRDFEDIFGISLNWHLMRQVAVQMVIGDQDNETWEINDKDSSSWMEGVDATGKTRLERLQALRENYKKNGISVRYDMVSGVGHEDYKVLQPVKQFFSDTLNNLS